MSKIVLDEVTNGNNISKINENFSKLETALNSNVLYRNNPVGEPNSLSTDIDVNSVRLYNLPKPIFASEPIRLQDADELFAGVNPTVLANVMATVAGDASKAAVSANNAASSATAASQSALLAQSFSQLGFNASFTSYDFGSVAQAAPYFPIDFGGLL